MKLWASMNGRERLDYLREYGGRDDAVRFLVEHWRLRSLHPCDRLAFEDDVRELVDLVIDNAIASGRAIERQAVLESFVPSPGGFLQ